MIFYSIIHHVVENEIYDSGELKVVGIFSLVLCPIQHTGNRFVYVYTEREVFASFSIMNIEGVKYTLKRSAKQFEELFVFVEKYSVIVIF